MVAMSQEGLQAGRMQQWNAGVEFEILKDLVRRRRIPGQPREPTSTAGISRGTSRICRRSTNLLKAGNEWSWVSDAASAAAAGVPYPYPGFANYAFMALAPFPRVAET